MQEVISPIQNHAANTSQYIDILEKTNQQLSLWYGPYEIILGILTFLVAVLAIFFAYILWRQSREYRQAFNDFLDEQKKINQKELKKFKKDTSAYIEKAIEEATAALESVEGEARERIEQNIGSLRKIDQDLDNIIEIQPVVRGALGGTTITDIGSRNIYEPFNTITDTGPSLISLDSNRAEIEEIKRKIEKLTDQMSSENKPDTASEE